LAGLAAFALGLCVGPYAHAQNPSPIVPQTRLDQTPTVPQTAAPAEPPKASLRLPAIAPFELSQVQVEGSTLSSAALEGAWRSYVGHRIAAAELVEITDAIVRRYGQSDVALYTVVVPDQDFAEGRLRVRVIEGHIEGLMIDGGDPDARAAVRSYLGALVGVRPLTKTMLQRQLSLARDLPAVRTDVQFAEGTAEGAAQLVAKLSSQQVQFGLSVNNRGAAFLGRTQATADLYINHLVPGAQTRLTYVTPVDSNRFRYVGLTQSQTFAPSGALLQLNAGYLRTRPKGSTLVGEAKSAGLQLTYPLRRSFDRDLYLSAGLDGLDANSAFLGNTFSDDRTRALRLSILYVAQNQVSRVTASAAASLGLDALGARTLVPDITDIDFTKVSGRLTLARQLTPGLYLRLGAIGQWSQDRLPAAEQFAFGGSEFGRGFESAALLGDSGYAGSAELALRPAWTGVAAAGLELFSFVDRGSTVQRRRSGSARVEADLASAGLGVRGSIRDRVLLQLEATTGLDASAPGVDNEDRIIFSLRSLW
jgi:hemolysin activation/secretion protein